MSAYTDDRGIGSLHIVRLRSITKLGSKYFEQLPSPPSLFAVSIICVVIRMHLSKAFFKIVGSRPRVARGRDNVLRSGESWAVCLTLGVLFEQWLDGS